MEKRDIVIMGCGPAGIQAAIHASKRCSVSVFGDPEKSNLWNAHIDNYLSVEYPIMGRDLLLNSIAKAKEIGVEFYPEDIMSIEIEDAGFAIRSETKEFLSSALILAPGIRHERLNIPGEKEFLGKGVSYCADCDCMFFKGKRVVVAGGGSAAARAADILLNFADKVYLVFPEFSISESFIEGLKERGCSVINAGLKEIRGTEKVEKLILSDGTELEVDGVFVELGSRGIYEVAMELGIMLDAKQMKFVQTDNNQKTNIEGIYAAGDVTGPPFQLAKALGQGCVAGIMAADYVKTKTA